MEIWHKGEVYTQTMMEIPPRGVILVVIFLTNISVEKLNFYSIII